MTQTTNQIYEFKIIPIFERYYNDETNWGVYNFTTTDDIPQCKDYNDPFQESYVENTKQGVLCGKMQQIFLGSEYIVNAKLEYNSKYKNYQYNPINITAVIPKSEQSQRVFLEAIITKRQADILLEAYPNIVEDTVNGNVENIDLERTKGIKDYTWNYIKERIINNYVISDIITLLQPIGVTYAMIKKLLMHYDNPTLLKNDLLDNPYILTKINGLGFKRVDGLALKLKPELKVSNKRTYSFINYYLREIGESNGHTWVTFDFLENAVRDNIIECEELYYKILNIEKETQALLYVDEEKNRIGLKYYRDIEIAIFQILKELDSFYFDWKLDVEKGILQSEKEQGFEFSEDQKDIIKESTKNNVVGISGKAGVGKTSISRALLTIYKNNNRTIGAAALSAKAAQRITEATGFQASTIHRLLGAKGLNEFTYNYENPLPYDVILADECSMNNARIFYDLVSAIRPGARLIISGDCRQLPPIGFGNVFSDLLELKEQFNIYELTKVHRQAEKSGILTDANLIREGINPIEVPEFKIVHGELQDMFYMFRDNKQALNDIAIKMFLKSIEEDGLDNVIIITPRKKDCINSTTEINKIIQDKLIGNQEPYLLKGNLKFKLGAKVIQRVNNYDKNIFNGEIGYVTDIFKARPTDEYNNMFTVTYPEKIITYSKSELDQIDLAYCLTCHLVQGSGYKTAIVIIDNSHYALLDSCLLYTAITRAKQRCLLLAEPSAFKKCIVNNKSIERQTWFKDFN
jgi:exodeoxyribonuclease V alpha subunit